MSENENEETTQAAPVQEMAPVTPTVKTVAVLASTSAMATAIQSILEPRMPGRKFVHVTKMNAIPSNGQVAIASLGLPNFLPTNRNWEIITLNTKYADTATARSAQWDMVRNANSTADELEEILGSPQTYNVFPEGQMMERKLEYVKLELAEAKATTDEERMNLLRERCELLQSQSAF